MNLVNEASLRRWIHSRNMRVGSNLYSQLEKEIQKMVSKAIFRAEDNQRTTVLARDM